MARNEARLAVEQVEDRLLMAAQIDVAGGDLGVLGTAATDRIIAFQLGNGNVVFFSPTAGLSTTTPGSVNVVFAGFFAVANGADFTDDFKVITGAGNDVVRLNGIVANDDFSVDMDAGNDRLFMRNTGGDVATLNGGAGNNTLTFNNRGNIFNSGDTTNFTIQ